MAFNKLVFKSYNNFVFLAYLGMNFFRYLFIPKKISSCYIFNRNLSLAIALSLASAMKRLIKFTN